MDPEGKRDESSIRIRLEDCVSSTWTAQPVDHPPVGVAPLQRSIKVTGLESESDVPLPGGRGNQTGAAGRARIVRSRRFRSLTVLEARLPNAHVRAERRLCSCWIAGVRAWFPLGTPEAMTLSRDRAGSGTIRLAIRKWDRNPSVLYAVHDGAIPGPVKPANHGRDTYAAIPVPDGRSTRCRNTFRIRIRKVRSALSLLGKAHSKLDTFAYGREGPATRASATHSTIFTATTRSLVEGTAGSQSPGIANPAGHVGRYLSADGDHVVFGTTVKLEPAGNENGDVTIYERDLEGGASEVVSTLPEGRR